MIIDQLQSRVKESERLTVSDLEECIIQAVNEYSGYYPRRMSVSLTSDGTRVYSLPIDWKEQFSYIEYLEYPRTEELLTSNPYKYPIPAIREASDYRVHRIHGHDTLLIMFDVPATEMLEITYCIPYTQDTICDLPQHHYTAFLNVATSYAFLKIAAIYGQSVNYQIGAEAVDYQNKTTEFIKQATWYRDRWEQFAGLGKYADNEKNEPTVNNPTVGLVYQKSISINRASQLFRPSYARPTVSYLISTNS